MKKNIALVLSSGGARGFAHIGAIEELERNGYKITSVSGSSMGALIGGMYAAGRLKEVKDWFFSLSVRQMLAIADLSPSFNSLVKGDRVIEKLKDIVPDVNIEDLPIPFTATATDIKSHKEIVISQGSLYEAIRASISIPSFFRPIQTESMILIDGGIVNPLPLSNIRRTKDDIMVAVNVSAPSSAKIEKMREHSYDMLRRDKKKNFLQRLLSHTPNADDNTFSLIYNTMNTMIEQNTQLSIKLYRPDILVQIPMNRFGEFDYNKAERISHLGKTRMREELAKYMKEQNRSLLDRIKLRIKKLL